MFISSLQQQNLQQLSLFHVLPGITLPFEHTVINALLHHDSLNQLVQFGETARYHTILPSIQRNAVVCVLRQMRHATEVLLFCVSEYPGH